MMKLVRMNGLYLESYEFTGVNGIEVDLTSDIKKAFDFETNESDLKRIARRVSGEVIEGQNEFVTYNTYNIDNVLVAEQP